MSAICLIAILSTLQASVDCSHGGRIGVVILDSPSLFDIGSTVEIVENAISENGRFTVVELPDSILLLGEGDNLIPAIISTCSDNALEVLLALSIHEPATADRTDFRDDSLITNRRTEVTVTGRFYSSGGTLTGTIQEVDAEENSLPYGADLDAMAGDAARRMIERALLELFPAEVRFEASESAEFDLPSGTDAGIRKGMFLSLVAVAPSIPSDVSQYRFLRSHGLAQVTDCSRTSSRARLLSGSLVEGGTVTALEQGAPAFVMVGWESAPVEIEQGAETGEEFDSRQLLNRIRLSVTSYRWGFCFGGALFAGSMKSLSTFGVDFLVGERIPISTPGLALRLNAGGGVDFMIQDVAEEYLASDASSVAFGGYAECGLEYLMADRLGIGASASGYLGTDADSWTVQDEYGINRDALPSEVFYASVARRLFSISAGAFYLIF